ncbi:DUF4493 domain-containing protein [Phocaeicola coprocola]|uniref:DUF4493 domain-containing protein n=1 Tax=Phocaeicola coprocola TaxID=310298 RepID=UPI00266EF295|nr:DUF4493 domain-containing protein [Phocaeicola coprocola]
MKRNILYILCGIFLLVGCQQKEVISGVGYISVSGIEIQSKTITEVASRATDDITWTVELWKGSEMLRTLSTEEMQNKIELDAADDYMLKVYSPNYGVEKGWTNDEKGEPVYYTEVPFVVKQGETTGLKVQVPTITFAVSLNLSEVIGDWLQEYDFTVTAGDRTVALDNGDIAYFPYSEGVSFSYQLTLTNSDSETNTLNGDWGKDEGEIINTNTIYTVVYNWDTHSLSLKE